MQFGVILEGDGEAGREIMKSYVKRLMAPDLMRSPFVQKEVYFNPGFGAWVFYLKPFYPNAYALGFPVGILPWVLHAPAWVLWAFSIIGGFMLFSGVAHSGFYYYLWCRAGLKRDGFKGKVKYLGSREILRLALVERWDFGTERSL